MIFFSNLLNRWRERQVRKQHRDLLNLQQRIAALKHEGPQVMSEYYRLDAQHNAVPCSATEWSQAFRQDRVVAKTTVYEGCEVSTVFLGLNHAYGDGPPLLFETLVFGGPFDQDGDRYSTWAEAETGHARFVERCQPILTENP